MPTDPNDLSPEELDEIGRRLSARQDEKMAAYDRGWAALLRHPKPKPAPKEGSR